MRAGRRPIWSASAPLAYPQGTWAKLKQCARDTTYVCKSVGMFAFEILLRSKCCDSCYLLSRVSKDCCVYCLCVHKRSGQVLRFKDSASTVSEVDLGFGAAVVRDRCLEHTLDEGIPRAAASRLYKLRDEGARDVSLSTTEL